MHTRPCDRWLEAIVKEAGPENIRFARRRRQLLLEPSDKTQVNVFLPHDEAIQFDERYFGGDGVEAVVGAVVGAVAAGSSNTTRQMIPK